jgi:translation initiation factor 1
MSKELFAGLPDELQDLLDDTSKSSSNIEIKIEKRKYGKQWAVITGFELDNDGMKALLKNIKNKLACAGTIKGKAIEILYGRNDRSSEVIDILADNGFNKDSVHVVK